MAALSLSDVKTYLRVTGNDDDDILEGLIESSKIQLVAQTGKHSAGNLPIEQNELFKTAQKQMVAQAYANREGLVSGGVTDLPHSANIIIEVIKNTDGFSVKEATNG